MRLAITGDNHLDHLYGDAAARVREMKKGIESVNAQAMLCLGDITSGRYHKPSSCGQDELLDNSSMYVLGNHDLWSIAGRRHNPDYTLANVAKTYKERGVLAGYLEASMTDKVTVIKRDGVAFVGTIGFPDFLHPKFIMPPEYYNKSCCTNDGTYMDLTMGWKFYTDKIFPAFKARLDKAVDGSCKTIVVGTHYPVFEEQYKMDGSDISAYFFCHTVGQMVKEVSYQHPDKRFWVFSAHAHEYNRGFLTLAADNVATYGLTAEYGRLTFAVFDLDKWVDQDVKQYWFPEPCKLVIETVESAAEPPSDHHPK
jgi:hypothetical protein